MCTKQGQMDCSLTKASSLYLQMSQREQSEFHCVCRLPHTACLAAEMLLQVLSLSHIAVCKLHIHCKQSML